MKAQIYDLPSVLENTAFFLDAEQHKDATRGHTTSWRQNILLHPGDFFEDKLPSADLFLLSRIVHDWSIASVSKLLDRVYAALNPNGAIFIAEMLLNESGDGPASATLQSLNMLVQTDGRERSFSEYRNLLQAHGFVNVQCKRSGTYLDGILALMRTGALCDFIKI